MTEYPKDVMEKARTVRAKTCADAECTFDAGCGCLDAIAQALMEERERCAKVAEKSGTPFRTIGDEWHAIVGPKIAAAIRSGGE